jgi:hypothetical protein
MLGRVLPVLLLVLTAGPASGRFVLEVGQVPVAELRVTSDGARYSYEATHFLDEGPSKSRFDFVLSELAAEPEVLALLTRPKAGCRDVLEERTKKLEALCVDDGPEVTGTLARERFTARYGRDDQLVDIVVGAAHWHAASTTTTPPAVSPFTKGVAVPEGRLRLEPEVKGATWLAHSPEGIGNPEDVGRTRCLLLARRALEGHPKRRLAVGLVIEAGRAFPHAWVVEKDRALDPSVEGDDEVLAQRRYLEIPREKSGSFFLQLFEGTQRLVKK